MTHFNQKCEHFPGLTKSSSVLKTEKRKEKMKKKKRSSISVIISAVFALAEAS